MERILVGLTTLVLLFAGAAYVRAGYVFPRRFEAVGTSDGRWLNPPDGDPFGDGIVTQTLNHSFNGSLGRLGDFGSGSRLTFEATSVAVVYPANVLTDELLKLLARRFTSEITFFVNVAGSRLHEASLANLGSADRAPFGDVLLADLLYQRGEGREDPFLAKFGNLSKGDVQFADPARPVLNASTNRLWSEKLLWSLALLGVGALGLIGYVWRLLRPKPYRYAAGRRPHAPYRTSNLPNPPRTIGSPPP